MHCAVILKSASALALLAGAAAVLVFGHCDGLDGPVVAAARQAFAERNVNRVLIWVKQDDEGEVREAFQKALAVRELGPEARDLADRSFFETLVRVHRAGEGAPYTGLKPAGRDLGPAIPAADRALAAGSAKEVEALLAGDLAKGLRERFERVRALSKFEPNDVTKGREWVEAYVTFIHYVEGIHQAVTGPVKGHFEEGGGAEKH